MKSLSALIALVFILSGFSTLSVCRADDGGPPTSQAAAPIVTGPYCGLLSVYAAMKYEGMDVKFPGFVKSEYVGDSEGSTLAELEKCATDFGAHAVPISGIDWKFLETVGHPVVLHVKSAIRSSRADHYILFMRCVDGQARIIDAPGPAETISGEELMLRADGLGLVVSKEPINSNSVLHRSRVFVGGMGILIFFLSLVIGAVALSASGGGLRRWNTKVSYAVYVRRAIYQSGMMVLLSIGTGFVIQSVSRGKSLARFDAAQSANVPLVSLDEVTQRVHDHVGLIVDARHLEDFDLGHIQGSINIPTDMPEGQRRHLLAAISYETPIVVYCQSSGCPYSDAVAGLLETDGFQNVSVFRGGWLEWSSKTSK